MICRYDVCLVFSIYCTQYFQISLSLKFSSQLLIMYTHIYVIIHDKFTHLLQMLLTLRIKTLKSWKNICKKNVSSVEIPYDIFTRFLFYFNVIRFFLQMQSETRDERFTYLDDSMVPDQFPHAVEHEGEAHAEHDQRENDQDYDDMLGIDQPRFLLLWGRK